MGTMIKKLPLVPPLSFQAPSPASPLPGSVTQSSYHSMTSGAPSIG